MQDSQRLDPMLAYVKRGAGMYAHYDQSLDPILGEHSLNVDVGLEEGKETEVKREQIFGAPSYHPCLHQHQTHHQWWVNSDCAHI